MSFKHKLVTTLIRRFPLLYRKYSRSYAQYGEDVLLKPYYDHNPNYKGFFVDVGAHHPIRFSNTYLFYKRGWRGINIEPTPGSKRTFDLLRSRDINLNIGISTEAGTFDFYAFDDPALNGFSKELSLQRAADTATPYAILNTHKIVTQPLRDVLTEHLPPGQTIDLLTIDVEGGDLDVLKSNDWNRFRPQFIMVEDDAFSIERPTQSDVYTYLTSLGYRMVGKTLKTLLFTSDDANV
ncbi:FkbM family methyltransferase [Spirosoma flavum]|uniref:FkbM family methyltransferase n=1 Tax=Spirosoma flavum TaxID=2048557 RepID=A0ABW6AS72_9BACT